MAKGPERKTIDDLRFHLGENHIICFFESKKQLSQKVKEAIKKTFPPPEPTVRIKHTPLIRLAATLLIPIAAFLYLKFAPPGAKNDLEPDIPKIDIATLAPTSPKKEEGKPVTNDVKPESTQKKTKNNIEPKPGKTGDTGNPGKANTKATPPQKGATTNVKLDKLDPVVEIEKKGAKIQKNTKGCWEADVGDGIVLIYIPPGDITMGSDKYDDDEKPIHKVFLDGYWIGKTEVTVGQYKKFVNETKTHYPRWLEPGSDCNIETGSGDWYKQMGEALTGENYPIIGVSWHDAVAYCEWLSNKKGIKIVLPTEAQWEKAARGTDGRKYPWGNGELTGKLANSSLKDGCKYTSPVGSFPAGLSPYGAMDMAGNVWEWCQDWFDSGYYKNSPKQNPKGPKSCEGRVMRGGSWILGSDYSRCAYRNHFLPVNRDNFIGFRLARSL